MSKVKKLIKTPKLFFVDMFNKRMLSNSLNSSTKVNIISNKINDGLITVDNNIPKNTTLQSQPKKTVKKTTPPVSTHDSISMYFNTSNLMELKSETPILLYLPWIQEHSNDLVEKINSCASNDFTIIPLQLAKDPSSKENRKSINKFAREHPEIYKKIIARTLMSFRQKIKGFVFTLDWNPAMRLIVDVCRDYKIPTILIPHESIFINQEMYYTDITALASVPKTDVILSWGKLQSKIFSERGYPLERIYEVGTPKFDAYNNYKPLLTRDIFCKIFGIEATKKIILFSAQPLDSQLDQKVALESQQLAIQDLLKYTGINDIQLILRMPPSKDDILGKNLRTLIDNSDNAVIDDANYYLVPAEEAIYHTDIVTSINSTMLFEGVLMNKPSLSMKYVEFDQIWVKAGIPAVKNYLEMEAMLDTMISGAWQHPVEGIKWAANKFSIGKFDGNSTIRIKEKINKFLIDIDNGVFSFLPTSKERFFSKNRIDVVAIPSNSSTLQNTQLYLPQLLNANNVISTHVRPSNLSALASVEIFFQWGITESQTKLRQKKIAKELGKPLLIIEDGFIRSVKIGLSGTPTLSIITDDTTAYYDATKQSRLERLLQDGGELTDEQKDRSIKAIEKIVQNRVSKYNDSINVSLPIGRDNVNKILLIDQRNGDQSVPAALASEKSFETMLASAISNNPNADIIIKQHPDAIKGGKSSFFNNDLVEQYRQIYPHIYTITIDINPYSLFEQVTDVYVVSSGVGFEALMAGKNVYCFGAPYYSGWGVTQDYIKLERRNKTRAVEDIFYFAFIESSRYFNPDKNRICEVEELVDYIVKHRS